MLWLFAAFVTAKCFAILGHHQLVDQLLTAGCRSYFCHRRHLIVDTFVATCCYFISYRWLVGATGWLLLLYKNLYNTVAIAVPLLLPLCHGPIALLFFITIGWLLHFCHRWLLFLLPPSVDYCRFCHHLLQLLPFCRWLVDVTGWLLILQNSYTPVAVAVLWLFAALVAPVAFEFLSPPS